MILSVQYLRGLVALLIVLFHATLHWGRLGGGGVPPILSLGSARVDVFFVISGFVLWLVGTRARSPGRFLGRRLLRVLPLYWLVTLLVLAVALVAPAALSTTQLQPAHVAASFLFIAWPHPGYPMTAPLLIPGWTLNYEVLFYLLFTACLGLRGGARLGALLGLLAGLVLLGLALPEPGPVARFYTSPVLLEFGAGALLGHAHARGLRLPLALSAALVLGGLAALLLFGQQEELPRLLRWGAPAWAIVAGLAFLERECGARGWAIPRIRLLALTGSASFAIYLTHAITLPVVARGWSLLHLPLGDAFAPFALACLLASWLVGLACHAWLDRPLQSLLAKPRPAGAPVLPGAQPGLPVAR